MPESKELEHNQAFEFQYIMAGSTAYLDLTTAQEQVFRKGDFYVIEPGVVLCSKIGARHRDPVHQSAAGIESGELKIDNESKEAAWVPPSSAFELPLAESQRRRLKDVTQYQKERRTFLS